MVSVSVKSRHAVHQFLLCVSLPHPPESPRALRLVDVDEVGHHAALEQTSLSLHADLEHNETQKKPTIITTRH